MMRFTVGAIASFTIGLGAATAQETALGEDNLVDAAGSHEAELADLQRRLEVASMRFLIASEIAKIAEEESKTAISQAEGAERRRLKAISEATSRQSNPGRISLVTARLTTGPNRQELCDMKWQLAYECNGLPECAVPVSQDVCGGVSSAGASVDLTIQYACGKPEDPEYETRRGDFRYSSLNSSNSAFLTCY